MAHCDVDLDGILGQEKNIRWDEGNLNTVWVVIDSNVLISVH